MLNQEEINSQLQTLKQGEKVIFKSKEGKAKVFYLPSGFYYLTFNGREIETIKDINAIYETIIDLLKIEI
ncbi:MAG: hypothetical protein V4585_00685 [Bacteroidota bacterium]|jgi:hypothetical protein